MFTIFLILLSLIKNFKKWKRQKHHWFLLVIYNDMYVNSSMAINYFSNILLKYYIRLYINT